jgi:hypothetical protein
VIFQQHAIGIRAAGINAQYQARWRVRIQNTTSSAGESATRPYYVSEGDNLIVGSAGRANPASISIALMMPTGTGQAA